MTTLFFDTETYSEVPIGHGTDVYARGAEIMLATYAIDDGPVQHVDFANGETSPQLLSLLEDPSVPVVIQNSFFDRTVMHYAWGLDLPVQRIHDTMVIAMAHGLPGGLDKLGHIFGLEGDQAKDADGKRLIQLFCKPRPKNMKLRRATRETHPEDWAKFIAYARTDIEAMRAVYYKLPKWNYQGEELALWHLDQKINDRGVAIDLELAHAAVGAAAVAQFNLATRTKELTNGEVTAATKRDALLAHILADYGIELLDLKSSTLEKVLAVEGSSLPVEVVELINLRLRSSATSATKYKTLITSTSPDGRLRGMLQFCGALRTGRWAGRKFQPQNLMRVPKYIAKQYDFAVATIKANAVDLFFDNVMEVLGSCVRGAIVAPPGKKLVVADLANIEGRMLAWLAGEQWKLQAFRDFDRGIGEDLYKVAYGKSFNVDPATVGDSSEERQIGKVQELMLGYQGGVGAFLTGAATYSIDLDAMAAAIFHGLPADVVAEAKRAYDWAVKEARTYGLDERTWLTCDSIKRLWRRGHPETVTFWPDLEHAVRQAILYTGTQFECRQLKVLRSGDWLRIRLPSGRQLVYPQPEVDAKGRISYMGINQYSRKWRRLHTYGGKLVENVTQAAARDVLARNMPTAENAGYELVLTVHDEDITEVPDSPEFNVKTLAGIMATIPDWAQGLPLAAAGYECHRYRKG